MRYLFGFSPILISILLAATALGVVPASAAGEDPGVAKFRRVLRATLKAGNTPCPSEVDPTITEVVFAFEGGGGYAPAYYLSRFVDPHTEDRGEDFFDVSADERMALDSEQGFWNWQDGRILSKPRSWSEEKFALYHEFYQSIDRLEDGNRALIEALNQASQRLDGPVPKIVLYYPWNSSVKAAVCAVRLRNRYQKAGRKLAISAIGYSLGGYTTALFARFLNWNGMRLKNVLTLDAVPYTHQLYASLRQSKNQVVISVPSNHDHWLNLFQRKDENTLYTKYRQFPIHGVKFSGGVKNRIPINSRDGKQIDDHLDVPDSEPAIAEMVRILTD